MPRARSTSTGSVWYKWTAPSSGSATFDTVGSGFDTVLGIYTGTSVSTLTEIDSNDDIESGNTKSRVTFAANSGTTYHIAVYGYNGANGSFTLNWSLIGGGGGGDSSGDAKYALCVGLNNYDMTSWKSQGWGLTVLKGCVNDATYFRDNLVDRGGWPSANVTKLVDSGATKAAIRSAIQNYAAKAVSGDTFIYMHSSHALNHTDTSGNYTKSVALAAYAGPYEDTELASDLARFPSGVKVVVIVDACHSGGLFKAPWKVHSFDLAERVSALVEQLREEKIAKGEKDYASKIASSEIGWATAAEYNETSADGGFYDSDVWLTDWSYIGNVWAGAFMGAFTWGWWNGLADTTGAGDNDGQMDAYEGYKYAYSILTSLDLSTPQYLNASVLRSVELGSGDSATHYTVRYRKYDGSGETATEQFECGKTYRLAWMDSQLGWMRSGYEFCGWVPWNPDTKARLCKYDNGQPVKDLAAAGETIELYCGWKSASSYRVCFHRCAGPDDLTKMNQVILRNKEDNLAWMDSMIGWKRDGYTFAGWDESDKATTVKYANGAKVKNLAMDGGTKHLYAVWRAKDDHKYPYTVKFYRYDGSGATRTQSFKAGKVQNLLWMDSQLGWSRDGYEFCGWVPWNPDTKPRLCKYVNGQKVVDLASTSGEVVNLYAAWKSSSSYRVCFNRNDGTGVKMNQVILRNKEDNLAWMDSQIGWKRDGYVFKGWAETEKGAVKYANGAKVKNLAMDGGTKHLYAIWRVAD